MLNIARRPWQVLFHMLMLMFIVLVSACSSENTQPMTPEEVRTLKFRTSVEGYGFDVPVNYLYDDFEVHKRWPRPPRAQVEGRGRDKVDEIKITALLPDMEPYTEANAAQFAEPGFGKKVLARLYKRRYWIANWQYYFSAVGPFLTRLPDTQDAPGMVHYRYERGKEDVYLSYDHPENDLIRIICKDKLRDWEYQACHVDALYSDSFNFYLAFDRAYLSQWREIDRKIQALFDRFHDSALQQPQTKKQGGTSMAFESENTIPSAVVGDYEMPLAMRVLLGFGVASSQPTVLNKMKPNDRE